MCIVLLPWVTTQLQLTNTYHIIFSIYLPWYTTPISYVRTAYSVGIPKTTRGHTSQPNDTHLPTNVKKENLLVHIHCCCILWRTTNTFYKGKLKKSLLLTPWGVYNSTLGLDRVEWLTSRPGSFTFGQGVSSTHCIGGWVEPIVGLDILDKKNYYPCT
jgi:hypothetical protein